MNVRFEPDRIVVTERRTRRAALFVLVALVIGMAVTFAVVSSVGVPKPTLFAIAAIEILGFALATFFVRRGMQYGFEMHIDAQRVITFADGESAESHDRTSIRGVRFTVNTEEIARPAFIELDLGGSYCAVIEQTNETEGSSLAERLARELRVPVERRTI